MSGHLTVLPNHDWSWRRATWKLFVERMKRTDYPIFVGPWHGEVGFEVLYWIPFLERLKSYGISPDRLFPISRGGASAWYGTPQGLELYAMRTPQQVRVENRVQSAKTGLLKQIHMTPFDRAVVTEAAGMLKAKKYHVIHPAWMYHNLAPYWTAMRGSEWLMPKVAYATIQEPKLPQPIALPEQFVAVKFYARETFPYHHKQANQFITATLQTIADQYDVVIMDSPLFLDDHSPFAGTLEGARVHYLKDLVSMNAETNLMVQSAVLSRSMGFVGSYGGFAQLALRMGKPSMSFYTEWGGTSIAHKFLSDLISIKTQIPFQVFRLNELAMTRSVLPSAEMPQIPQDVDAGSLQTA